MNYSFLFENNYSHPPPLKNQNIAGFVLYCTIFIFIIIIIDILHNIWHQSMLILVTYFYLVVMNA